MPLPSSLLSLLSLVYTDSSVYAYSFKVGEFQVAADKAQGIASSYAQTKRSYHATEERCRAHGIGLNLWFLRCWGGLEASLYQAVDRKTQQFLGHTRLRLMSRVSMTSNDTHISVANESDYARKLRSLSCILFGYFLNNINCQDIAPPRRLEIFIPWWLLFWDVEFLDSFHISRFSVLYCFKGGGACIRPIVARVP